ncbi:MAG: hypothetical protein ABI867_05335 [Kofleriaceae bacterium]
MKRCLVPVFLAATAGVASADSIGADPNDPGRVTAIQKGVKELDLGGIFVLSYNKNGDAEANTRVSTLGGASFQYFIKDSVSLGGTFLFSYDRLDATTYSTSFGGLAFASLHVRLGLGAFLRPTFGAGLLAGNLNSELAPGMVTQASQVAGLIRIALPFAYFPSRRVVLQAGPEINVSIGNVTPDGGEAESFTSVSGGFGVSAGYAF